MLDFGSLSKHKKCVKVKTALYCGMKLGNIIGFCGEAKVGYKLAK